MARNELNVGTVPVVGHGNPASLEAIRRLAEQNQITLHDFHIKVSPLLAQVFHIVMSKNRQLRDHYTSRSENLRSSRLGQTFAALCFLEFQTLLMIQRANHLDNQLPIIWWVVQEHPVLGSNKRALQRLNIQEVRVHVPDTFPKQSAELALRKLDTMGIIASFYVWNTQAYDELNKKGFDVKLTAPPLLEAYQPDKPEYWTRGKEVVIKSSGSGMPKKWSRALQSALPHAVIHTPQGNPQQDIARFFQDLGGNTRLIIAHPSEVIQIAYSMRQRGQHVHVPVLPPRGDHELRNLKTAMELRLVTQVVDFGDGVKLPDEFSELQRILVYDLKYLLQENPAQPNLNGFLGTEPIFKPVHLSN
jgi:hypothetical protein